MVLRVALLFQGKKKVNSLHCDQQCDYLQGFRTAEKLANKVVPFFKLCDEQLSSQSHYDFGLRALKYVLVSAGNVKRERIQEIKKAKTARGEAVEEAQIAENLPEQEILIQVCSVKIFVQLTVQCLTLLTQCKVFVRRQIYVDWPVAVNQVIARESKF